MVQTKEERKAYNKAYYLRPEIKAKAKAYRDRPEAKAKQREYIRRPENIAKSKDFLLVSSSPLTRSSYHADEDFAQLQKNRLEKYNAQSLS